jgi:Asp/Glu/hydantoin racemase
MAMRIWVQVFSSPDRNPDFHKALKEHLSSVAGPDHQIEVYGSKRGGLGEQFRFFQAIDTADLIDNILKCKNAKGAQRYDAFVSLNSTDPVLHEAREILDIPVLGFLETNALMACMMGQKFSLITPNLKFAVSYRQKLELYKLTDRLASIEAMDFPNLTDYRKAYTDPEVHKRFTDEFDRAARRAVAAGAEVIIPCGSHAVLEARRKQREIDGALVVDGLAILMKMTIMQVELQKLMGMVVSRKRLYEKPGESVLERARKDYGIEF